MSRKLRSDAIPMVGKRYGDWTVVEDRPPRVCPAGGYRRMVLCRCECGVVAEVSAQSLRVGDSRGCEESRRRHISESATQIRLATGESLREAAENYGIDRGTLYGRLKRGMTELQALRAAATMRGLTIDGRWRLLKDWLADIGISREAYRLRLMKGLTPEEAATTPKHPGGRDSLREKLDRRSA